MLEHAAELLFWVSSREAMSLIDCQVTAQCWPLYVKCAACHCCCAALQRLCSGLRHSGRTARKKKKKKKKGRERERERLSGAQVRSCGPGESSPWGSRTSARCPLAARRHAQAPLPGGRCISGRGWRQAYRCLVCHPGGPSARIGRREASLTRAEGGRASPLAALHFTGEHLALVLSDVSWLCC